MAVPHTRVTSRSPLQQMTRTTPTRLWNDSASIEELTYSMEHGAVGATCNPVIAVTVLKKEMATWRPRIESLLRERPTATEDEIGWRLVEELSVRAAELLEPVFAAEAGRNGRLSIQTDPRYFRNTNAIVEQAGLSVDPGYLEWAGVAVFKKTYGIFRQRGYRVRLLSAAFRNHMHWSELVGADAVISPPYSWQKRFNASDIEVKPRIDNPVDPKVVSQLLAHFPDFRRAYSEDGLTTDEFDHFGPTLRTLRQFIAACGDLAALVRDVMVPTPTRSS